MSEDRKQLIFLGFINIKLSELLLFGTGLTLTYLI